MNKENADGIRELIENLKKEAVEEYKREHVIGWIPCSERMPEDGVDVLIWFEYFQYGNCNCMQKKYGVSYTSNGEWSGSVNGLRWWRQMKVLYWMPLPEPPESEEE